MEGRRKTRPHTTASRTDLPTALPLSGGLTISAFDQQNYSQLESRIRWISSREDDRHLVYGRHVGASSQSEGTDIRPRCSNVSNSGNWA